MVHQRVVIRPSRQCAVIGVCGVVFLLMGIGMMSELSAASTDDETLWAAVTVGSCLLVGSGIVALAFLIRVTCDEHTLAVRSGVWKRTVFDSTDVGYVSVDGHISPTFTLPVVRPLVCPVVVPRGEGKPYRIRVLASYSTKRGERKARRDGIRIAEILGVPFHEEFDNVEQGQGP